MINPYYRKLLPGMVPRYLSPRLGKLAVVNEFIRNASNGVMLEDVLAVQAEWVRSNTDALGLSDSVDQVRDLPLSLSSSASFTGSLQRLVDHPRSITSAISTGNTATRTIDSVPAGMEQLLLPSSGHEPYYSEAEYPGKSYLLRDYSTGKGTIYDKRVGRCLHLDGVDDYAITANNILNPSSSDLSVSLYVKFDTLSADQTIVQIGNAEPAAVAGAIVAYNNLNNKFAFFFASSTLLSTLTPVTNTWYHVVITFDTDPTAAVLRVYINGSLDSTHSSITPLSFPNAWTIGRGKTAVRHFDGRIYGVRVYDKVLSGDEVTYLNSLGQSGVDPTETNLVAHWPMQEEDKLVGYNRMSSENLTYNFATSAHVTDTGVVESTINDLGGNFAYVGTGVSATDTIEIIPTAVAQNITTGELRFKIKTTDNEFTLFSNNGGTGPLIGIATTSTGPPNSISGYSNIFVDGVEHTTRTAFRDAVNDGNTHEVSIPNINLSTYTNGLWFSGHAWGFTGYIWDLEIAGKKYPGPVKIPAASPTLDAEGGTLTDVGPAHLPGIVGGPVWRGGSNMLVNLGVDRLPTTGDFVLSFPYKPSAGSDNARIFSRYNGSSTTSIEILQNASGSELKLVVGTSGLAKTIGVPSDFSIITLSRVANLFTLSCSNGQQVTHSEPITLGTGVNDRLLAISNATANLSTASVGPVSYTISGVTTTLCPVEDSRDIAVIRSDGTSEMLYDAVFNGVSLTSIYTTSDGKFRLPIIEHGGCWAGQNLALQSESYVGWTRQGSSVSALDVAPPTGIESGIMLFADGVLSTTTARLSLQTGAPSVTAGQPYTISTYFKEGNTEAAEVLVYQNNPPSTVTARLTFATVTASISGNSGPYTNVATSVEDVGDGWYRLILTFEPTQTGTLFLYVGAQGSGFTSASFVRVTGSQLNTGTTAHPYRKTTTTTRPNRALIPAAPGASLTANGNPITIPKGKFARSLAVDRTAGSVSPLEFELGTNAYNGELFDDSTSENNIDKRVSTDYADRLGASWDDISADTYFD